VSADLKARTRELAKTLRCNCNLDNWQPEPSTGHSWVCRIHRAATGQPERQDTRTGAQRAYDAYVTSPFRGEEMP